MFHQIIRLKNIINYWIPPLQWRTSLNFSLNFTTLNRKFSISKNNLIIAKLEKVLQYLVKFLIFELIMSFCNIIIIQQYYKHHFFVD
jgi:hypothetical protein